MATVRVMGSSATDLAATRRSVVDGSPGATPVMVEVTGSLSRSGRVRLPLDPTSARRLARIGRYSRAFRYVGGPVLVLVLFSSPIWFGELNDRIGWSSAVLVGAVVYAFVAAVLAGNVAIEQHAVRHRPRWDGEWIVIRGLDPEVVTEWASLNQGRIEILDG